ncbi:type II secretion system F family protein [Candidatus Uhrbacteria bacterium]|nr:type II secretion system F family protein [Candidatus Uhrbacteria bacterium]
MRFSYSARTKDGKPMSGALEAASRVDAEELLTARGYIAISVRERRWLGPLLTFVAELQRPQTKDVVIFLRQLSVMIAAKVPVVGALRALVRSTPNPALRAVILDLAHDVESGQKFSDALAVHPRVFSSYAIHIVRAGETTGRLDEVIGYLADQSERDEELKSKVHGAMVYPAFILSGLVVVAVVMMVFVIPRLTTVLTESGATLPFATRALMAVSSFMARWWWIIAAVIAAIVVAFRYALRSSPAVRVGWDRVKLRIPIFGQMTREVAVVRFARSFEMLLRGNVDVVPGLEVVRGVLGNAVFEELIDETIREVKDGNTMTSVFERSPHLPPMVPQLLAVGEETGRLQEVLAKLGDFFAREVDQRIRNLVTIIEPLVMIVMGVAVGVMVAAVIMPMYNLASQF